MLCTATINKLEKVLKSWKPSSNQHTLDVVLFPSTAQLLYTKTTKQRNKQISLNKRRNILFENTSYIGLACLKERKPDCTHVGHNSCLLYHLKSYVHQYCAGFKITECQCNHSNCTILVYMMINGSTWGQSCFHSLFLTGQSNIAGCL